MWKRCRALNSWPGLLKLPTLFECIWPAYGGYNPAAVAGNVVSRTLSSFRIGSRNFRVAQEQAPDLYEAKSTTYGNKELRKGMLTVDDSPSQESVVTLRKKP